MKKLLCSLLALGALLTWSGASSGQGPGPGSGDPGTLSAAEEATLLHMREFWRETSMNRMTWDAWELAGRPDPASAANEKAKQILETHEPLPLPEAS